MQEQNSEPELLSHPRALDDEADDEDLEAEDEEDEDEDDAVEEGFLRWSPESTAVLALQVSEQHTALARRSERLRQTGLKILRSSCVCGCCSQSTHKKGSTCRFRKKTRRRKTQRMTPTLVPVQTYHVSIQTNAPKGIARRGGAKRRARARSSASRRARARRRTSRRRRRRRRRRHHRRGCRRRQARPRLVGVARRTRWSSWSCSCGRRSRRRTRCDGRSTRTCGSASATACCWTCSSWWGLWPKLTRRGSSRASSSLPHTRPRPRASSRAAARPAVDSSKSAPIWTTPSCPAATASASRAATRRPPRALSTPAARNSIASCAARADTPRCSPRAPRGSCTPSSPPRAAPNSSPQLQRPRASFHFLSSPAAFSRLTKRVSFLAPLADVARTAAGRAAGVVGGPRGLVQSQEHSGRALR